MFTEGPQISLLLTAGILALVGFLTNWFLNDKLKQQAGPKGLFRLLGIPLGRGWFGMGLIICVMLALTIVCFWKATIFSFFPGINLAFETGGMITYLIRSIQNGGQARLN